MRLSQGFTVFFHWLLSSLIELKVAKIEEGGGSSFKETYASVPPTDEHSQPKQITYFSPKDAWVP